MACVEYEISDAWIQISDGTKPLNAVVKNSSGGRLLFNDMPSDSLAKPAIGFLYQVLKFPAEPVWCRATQSGGMWKIEMCDTEIAGLPSPVAITTTHYGDSIRFYPHNGENKDSLNNGFVYVPDTNDIFQTSVAFDTPILDAESAIGLVCEIPLETCNRLQRKVRLLGVDFGENNLRNLVLKYIPFGDPNRSSDWNKFEFVGFGEPGTPKFTVVSNPIPTNSSYRLFVVLRRFASGDFSIDLWDLKTGVQTPGPLVTPPVGWNGIQRLRENLSIGGTNEDDFPQDGPSDMFGGQNGGYFGGQIGDVVFVDGPLSDIKINNIVSGNDIATEIGASNLRLHFIASDDDGLLLTTTSNKAAFTTTTALIRGQIFAGGTLRLQGAQSLAFDKLPFPAPAPVEIPFAALEGKTNAEKKSILLGLEATVLITGTTAGVSGPLQMRITDEQGALVRDWETVLANVGPSFSVLVPIPVHSERLNLQFAPNNFPSVLNKICVPILCGFGAVELGQSQVDYGLSQNAEATIKTTDLSKTFSGDNGYKAFLVTGGFTGTADLPSIVPGESNPALMGDGSVVQLDALVEEMGVPVIIYNAGISGTSVRALMNDADTSRQWSDFIALLSVNASRNVNGQRVVTTIVYNWFSADPALEYTDQMLRPLLTGQESVTQSGIFIAQDDIDHWPRDPNGDINVTASFVIITANRSTTATVTDSDFSNPSLIRANQRNAALLNPLSVDNIFLGPEIPVHKIDLGVVGTHPDNEDELGVPVFSRVMKEGVLKGLGLGSFQGNGVIETVAFANPSNDAIRVKFAGPQGTQKLGTLGTGAPPSSFEVSVDNGVTFTKNGFTTNFVGSGPDFTMVDIVSTGSPFVAGMTQIAFLSGGALSYGSGFDDTQLVNGCLTWDTWIAQGGNDKIPVQPYDQTITDDLGEPITDEIGNPLTT